LRLSERSERSERSEFRNATTGRAAQGSRRAAATAAVKRSRPTARSSARAHFIELPSRCRRCLKYILALDDAQTPADKAKRTETI
jgi:hypothetical protein